jgi:tetraacyldisaccharide 4'-kinase
MRPPRFWDHDGGTLLPRLLSPLAAVAAGMTRRRVARPGWTAPVPVICCGNASVGGAGKTTVALDLAARLRARGVAAHFLTRGHGGRTRGPLLVDPATHDAALVGDEPLLLAQVAPTWVAADRAAGARAAIAAGAGAIVLDDGLQNPSLRQDLALLVIDGGAGFGNGRVIPAGPLREAVADAAARCQAALLIGEDTTGAAAALPPGLAVLRARLAPGPGTKALAGMRVLAFAGIGRPEKFFTTLREAGAVLAATRPLPDHHRYRATELARLLDDAGRLDAVPATTAKDAMRLPPEIRARVRIADIRLDWVEEGVVERLLAGLICAR